jgi:hypothetical protein
MNVGCFVSFGRMRKIEGSTPRAVSMSSWCDLVVEKASDIALRFESSHTDEWLPHSNPRLKT